MSGLVFFSHGLLGDYPDLVSSLTRLLFMTYNGMVMLAVAVGAFVGYLAFADDTPASKSIACH